MKKWFSTLGYKVNDFMYGRYGFDELSRLLLLSGFIMAVISRFQYLKLLYILGFLLLVWSFARAFSKNIYKRQMERNRYLIIKNKIMQKFRLYKGIWHDRKTHKYYKCPGCKTMVRIVKPGKGKRIMVTCPKCRQSFEKRI